MKIIAKCPVELNGHIYHKGDTCEYEGAIVPRICANFTAEDGGPLGPAAGSQPKTESHPKSAAEDQAAAVTKVVVAMGRDGIKRALDGMNVVYAPTAKTEYLAKLLMMSRGEIAAD